MASLKTLLIVGVGRCLVHYQYFVVPEHGPRQTHQLPLAHAEVRPVASDRCVQTRHDIFQLHFLEHVPYLSVAVFSEGVDILTHGCRKQNWLLRDDGQAPTQIAHT